MSESKIKIAVLGGDKRQYAAAHHLTALGFTVSIWGLPRTEEDPGSMIWAPDWRFAVSEANAVLMPIPMSCDGIRINFSLLEQSTSTAVSDLRITHLMDAMHSGQILFGGRIPPSCKAYAEERGFSVIDYSENELFQLRNALPTAEGALELAMRELPIIMNGIHAAVIGYGRIAQALVPLLRGVGAKVTVAARKPADLCRAKNSGCSTLRISNRDGKSTLMQLDKQCRVIFNTVPYWLFDRAVLANISPHVLIIDLASAPGGVDPQAAIDCGIEVIRAPGLPGKYAPATAGMIIAETIAEYFLKKGSEST